MPSRGSSRGGTGEENGLRKVPCNQQSTSTTSFHPCTSSVGRAPRRRCHSHHAIPPRRRLLSAASPSVGHRAPRFSTEAAQPLRLCRIIFYRRPVAIWYRTIHVQAPHPAPKRRQLCSKGMSGPPPPTMIPLSLPTSVFSVMDVPINQGINC